MAQDDALKRLYAEFPKLRDHADFNSQEEFNKWRTTNAPEIPESIWTNYLAPTTQVTSPPTEDASTNKNSSNTSTQLHTQHGSDHKEYKPNHDIEEDYIYKNTIKNHIEDWNKQNPQNKFSGKTFIKDDTGKIVLNPELKKAIPNIHDLTTSTMRTGFGDESVDKYKNAEKYRIYKNRTLDPTYSTLTQSNNPVDYDAYVNTHYEKSLGYAGKNKELKKALKRRDKRIVDEQKIQEKIDKVDKKARKKIYSNPDDDPLLQRARKQVDDTTESTYQEQLSIQKQHSNADPVDRESIRKSIQQEKYETFIKSNEKKARKYAKSNPELKFQLKSYDQRQKSAKEKAKELKKTLKKLRKNQDPNNDLRIQQLERSIQGKVTEHSFLPQNKLEEKTREIRLATFDEFARNNHELTKKYAKSSIELRSARERVTNAQEMARSRGLGYKIKNIFKKSSSGPVIPAQATHTPTSAPVFTLQEWKKRLSRFNTQQQEQDKEESQNSSAWRGRGFNRVKSYFQSNHAPEGTQPLSSTETTPSGGGNRPHPRRLRPRPPAGSAQAEKAATNFAKQAAMTGLRAAAPYIGIALLIIFIIILFILIIWYIVNGSKRKSEDFKISVSKTAPPNVDNGQIIEYKIDVTTSGTADKITVTDQLPINTELAEAPAGAELKDASGTITTDIKQARTVIWTILPGSNPAVSPPVSPAVSP